MTKLPQLSHERVVRALQRAGFYVLREGKHIAMTDEKRIVIIPRHHVIKPGTLKQILDAAPSFATAYLPRSWPAWFERILLNLLVLQHHLALGWCVCLKPQRA